MLRTVACRGRQTQAVAIPDQDDRTFPTQEDARGYARHLGVRWAEHHAA